MASNYKGFARYVLLVTGTDGTEYVYGPFTVTRIDKREQQLQKAFPDCHVRSVALRSAWEMKIDCKEGDFPDA